ncbi:unnamed protein product [Amoebophrya sp. A120]|nr:unnamed protein product [Amoebophrya sp. A120]|eukprot:GSA120T00001490001.1
MKVCEPENHDCRDLPFQLHKADFENATEIADHYSVCMIGTTGNEM